MSACHCRLPDVDEVTVELDEFVDQHRDVVKFSKLRLPSFERANRWSSAAHTHNAIDALYDNDEIEIIDGTFFQLFHYVEVVVVAIVGDAKAALTRMSRLLMKKNYTLPGLDEMKPRRLVEFCGRYFGDGDDDEEEDLLWDASFTALTTLCEHVTPELDVCELRLALIAVCAMSSSKLVAKARSFIDFSQLCRFDTRLRDCVSPTNITPFLALIQDAMGEPEIHTWLNRHTPLFCITSRSVAGLCVLVQIDDPRERRLRLVGVVSCGVENDDGEQLIRGDVKHEVSVMRNVFERFGHLMCQTPTVWVTDNPVLSVLFLLPKPSPASVSICELGDLMSTVCLYAMFVDDGDFFRIAGVAFGNSDLADVDRMSENWQAHMPVARRAANPTAAIALQPVAFVALRQMEDGWMEKSLKSSQLAASQKEVGAVLSSWAVEYAHAIQGDAGASIRQFMEAAKSGSAIGGMTFVLDEMVVWATADAKATFQLVVPEAMRARVVAVAHERFRCSNSATKRRVMSKMFWWPKMLTDIERLTICAECRKQTESKKSVE
jgi:hypothetical protein